MSFTQLIYSSRSKADREPHGTLDTLRSLLKVSQKNNTRDGLTGFLLFDRAHFFQALEGEDQRVVATYNRIQKDPRHGEVTLMGKREIRSRSFPQWSMGGALRSFDQQEIFVRHGIAGSLDPAKLTSPTILALTMDLQDFELSRVRMLQGS